MLSSAPWWYLPFEHLNPEPAAMADIGSASSSFPIKEIQSPASPVVKHCVRLRTQAKYRQENSRVLVLGKEIINELLDKRPGRSSHCITKLFAVETEDLGSWGSFCNNMYKVSLPAMQKLTGLQSVPGSQIAAELTMPPDSQLELWPRAHLTHLLVLDGVQDPGNLGSLLRTALALGWQAFFILPGCCDIYNEKAVSASKGACFKLPSVHGTWKDLEAICNQHKLVKLAADSNADSQVLTDGASRLGIARAAQHAAALLEVLHSTAIFGF
ncbi:hypothetical protein WJX84_006098 [Apatococcus fuscideae]|uniref:tRNA/rRNA methyltransferase SpoU type domain-containing protein n=1 Tax=Apatococcus fuscideae TaxID=2026836 RepID=A0AAW1TJW6_9CHLO